LSSPDEGEGGLPHVGIGKLTKLLSNIHSDNINTLITKPKEDDTNPKKQSEPSFRRYLETALTQVKSRRKLNSLLNWRCRYGLLVLGSLWNAPDVTARLG